MRFMVDVCVGRSVGEWLSDRAHDVRMVTDFNPLAEDEEILKISYEEHRILITLDKDFGGLVFCIWICS
jgi:predicted nuclease of predicted toxin-antitoxin system